MQQNSTKEVTINNHQMFIEALPDSIKTFDAMHV